MRIHQNILRGNFPQLAPVLCALGGLASAMALPPVNWSFLAFVGWVPLIYFSFGCKIWKSALYGFITGVCWALPAFFFLREINWVIPFLLAPVISLWTALFGALLPLLLAHGRVLSSRFSPNRHRTLHLALSLVALASLFTLIEFTRVNLFPWNSTFVAMWRNTNLIQIAAVTGAYGITFLILLVNGAIVYTLKTAAGRPSTRILFAVMVLVLTVYSTGLYARTYRPQVEVTEFRVGVVQGDISQRRSADRNQTEEALDAYLAESAKLLQGETRPEIILWPETAVPFPYRGNHELGSMFRRKLQSFIRTEKIPMLMGTLDFEYVPPGIDKTPRMTNSAIHFDHSGAMLQKYDKVQRVPYGEFIPFRPYLPEAIIRYIDMNRDLAPGTDFTPFMPAPQVRAGAAICYEGIFAFLAREFALRKANLLIVLSNDAWYPRSSEPEQHLANSVFNTIQTRLPMVRCGNNGGSLVLSPYGEIAATLKIAGHDLKRPELDRGRGNAVLTVKVPVDPVPTFFVRHGQWFMLVLLAYLALYSLYLAVKKIRRH